MEGQSSTAFTIFIYAVGAFLLFLIVLWSSQNFLTNKGALNTSKSQSVDCVALMYDITDLQYSSGQLSFAFTNKGYSNGDINELTIETDRETKDVKELIMIGYSRQFNISMEAPANVSIYPKGCGMYKKVVQI